MYAGPVFDHSSSDAIKPMLEKITPRYQALLILLIWGAILLSAGLIRLDAFGIDEGAARAILLVWSVVDRIINPVFILGLPDLRALLFAPVGIYWSGSIIAIKVFTALITFAAVLFFHQWSQRRYNNETALIGSGLLLIAPLTLSQIDAIAAGPYLLLGFGLGEWLNRRYRQVKRPLGGWFFLQLLLIIVLTSMHPLALAYPLALVIEWYKDPIDHRQQRHVFIGIGAAIIFTLLLRGGWDDLNWLGNPLGALSTIVINTTATGATTPALVGGAVIAILLLLLLIFYRTPLLQDLLGRMLVLALIIGAFCADQSWALIGLTVLLTLGVSALISLNSRMGGASFLGQRGLVMVLLLVMATVFMQGDKARQLQIAQNLLTPHDFLIQELTLQLEDVSDGSIIVMSQWPGRTMLALRRPAIPLPPEYKDSATLLANIKGVTHIIFDPRDPANKVLGQHLARLTAETETLALEPGGVIIRVKNRPSPQPAADADGAG